MTELGAWCANIAWAVTTEAECYGWMYDHSPERFALYDANEDDPPIAVFDDRETAERVAEALIRVGRAQESPKGNQRDPKTASGSNTSWAGAHRCVV